MNRHCYYCGTHTRRLRNKAQRLACTTCYDSEWTVKRDWNTSRLPPHLSNNNDTNTAPSRKRITPIKKDTP